MPVSIDQFAAEVRADIELFVKDWKKRMAESPEQYHEELPDDNSGLWYEFFSEFMLRDKDPD